MDSGSPRADLAGTHFGRRLVPITTERLELVPATLDLLAADLASKEELGRALGAAVPDSWPPELYDENAVVFVIDRLRDDPGVAGWWMRYVVLRGGGGLRVLIGSCGYKGPPDGDGTVELGYGIVAEHQRRGYATEATRGLVDHAFSHADVRRVIAETLPGHVASIGVLEKCGFRLLGEGSEPGVIRYGLDRPGRDEETA